jgi:hypothetical protein
MKSNKLKALLIILTFTLSSCSNLLRKTDEKGLENLTETTKSKIKSKRSKAKEPSNDWNSGFKFPKFEVKKKEDKDYVALGEINVFPLNMVNAETMIIPSVSTVSLTDDQKGFVMEFNVGNIETAKALSFTHYLGGLRIMIPWRFFDGKPYYQNPYGISNKLISANIIDDQGKQFNIKFSLPWKLLGWYISNAQAEQICSICENMSRIQNKHINVYKMDINRVFANLEANNNLKNTIPELQSQIKESSEKINKNEQSLAQLQNNIDQIMMTLGPMKIKKKILTDRNGGMNEQIEIYSRQIEDINNKDPNMQQKATAEVQKNKNLLNEKIKMLNIMAPDRKIEIEKAHEAALLFQQSEMDIELRKVGPLPIQSR